MSMTRHGGTDRGERTTLILNPRSGTASAAASGLVRLARAAGVEPLEMKRRTDLELAVRRRLESGVRHFVVAGGDGTLHKVARVLAGTGATVGVIPLGTYNRFARDAGIPFDWRDAFDIALHGPVRPVDVGVVNGVPFLSAVTLGLHTALLEERERLRSRAGRAFPVGRAIVSALTRFPLVQVDVSGATVAEHVRARVMVVSVNAVDFDEAGARRRRLDAGILSLCWLESEGRIALMYELAALLAGWRGGATLREATGTNISIDCRHGVQKVGIDGEITKLRTPLDIGIRPNALLVRRIG